jgi:hypothetical protein
VGIGTTSPAGKLHVDSSDVDGIYIEAPAADGVDIRNPGDSGVEIHNATNVGVYIDTVLTYDGVVISSPNRLGVGIWECNSHGVYVDSSAWDAVIVWKTDSTGVWVQDAGNYGGYFRTTNDAQYALKATNENSAQPGLYVDGYAVITGGVSKVVQTSKGREAISSLSTPYEEIMASGTGRLSNGEARIFFESLFSDAVSSRVPLKITVTPSGKWSGIYVAQRSIDGFTIRSETGALDVAFDWTAIGRRRGYEEKLALRIPTAEQERAERKRRRSRRIPRLEPEARSR